MERPPAFDVAILGAGLTGLSSAFHLQEQGDVDYVVLERESAPGGLAKSLRFDGFVFDYSIHILYTSDPYCDDLIRKRLLPGRLNQQQRESYCYSYGTFTEYPYQLYNYGLPASVIAENLLGLVAATYEGASEPPRHYEEWLYRTFGTGIADNFMVPYNRRQWAWDLTDMSYDWIAERVPVPNLRDVIAGALEPPVSKVGPNREFWYPEEGGIEALPLALADAVPSEHLRLGVDATSVDLTEHEVTFGDGTTLRYESLISSLPMPALAKILHGGPSREVASLAESLKNNRVHTVDIGLQGVDLGPITDMHWVYFPEEEFPFHRLSLPHRFSQSMVPAGCASIQLEVSESRYRPVDKETLVARSLDALCRLGVLEPADAKPVSEGGRVLLTKIVTLDPAYVIYDLRHRETVDALLGALAESGVFSAGRFGTWEYLNMDHSILSGKRAAETVLALPRPEPA
jgi:protoporphyrinogen oxidase